MEARRNPEPAKQRLLVSAARLLAERGVDVSTRAICEDAGVTAPTLYHYFGDRDGLMQAVVTHGFTEYLAAKTSLESTGDPIEDIRLGWADHQAWGTANPSFYSLMYGQVTPGRHAEAADEAEALLLQKLETAARRGLLRVPPVVACRMILAANIGLTLSMISDPRNVDEGASARLLEALLAAIQSPLASVAGSALATASPIAASAIALRSALAADPAPAMSAAELPLLAAWLDRLAAASPGEIARGR